MKLHCTHIDLDGIGCAVLTKLVDSEIQHAFLNYDTIDGVVDNLPYSDIEWFLLSDLMVTDKKLIQKLQNPCLFPKTTQEERLIIDHHLSATGNIDLLSQTFRTYFDTTKSATLLVYETFADVLPSQAKHFAYIVNDWDMWEKKMPESDDFQWLLNSVYSIPDKRNTTTLMNNFLYWIQYGDFTTGAKSLISEAKDRYKYDLSAARETIKDVEMEGMTFRFCWASRSVSRIADDLGGKKIVMIIFDSYGQAHFRTQMGNNFDVSKMAELFGGGGHTSAAGAGITPLHRLVVKLYDSYINN